MPDTSDLIGRTAIITGASRGLGREIARRFVKAGATTYVSGRDADALAETVDDLRRELARPGQRIEAFQGDVSSPADCARLVAAVGEELAPDQALVLVNNAGVYGPMGRIEDVAWEEWVEAVQINLFGAVLMMREAIPLMKARGYGKIVNLSGGGATGPLPRITAYAASKAALVRMTETIAEEVEDDHIDVNAIAPGALNTRLLDEVLAAGPEQVGEAFFTRAEEQRRDGGVPLDRGAELAVFLASSDSDGISGRLLSAVWDDWAGLPAAAQRLRESDVYTLRRIVPEDRGWTETER